MKSLMIVEDEKAIRAGLCAMVKQAPVTVETIIECRNGADAMDILQTQPVDVMITDIRMPKMDGVELVRRAGELPSPPIMVVISGYSEFDYAVDVFRGGVRDYLLKPVERERVYDLLSSLQTELDAKSRDKDNQFAITEHILKSMMLGVETGPVDINVLTAQCAELSVGAYSAVCLAPGSRLEAGSCRCFADVNGQTVLLVPETSLAEIKNGLLKGRSAGISGAKDGLALLREAYSESLQARKLAFVYGGIQLYGEMAEQPQPTDPAGAAPKAITAEQVVQLIGAGKPAKASDLLKQALFLAQNKRLSTDMYLGFLEQVQAGLRKVFSRFKPALIELDSLTDILGFENAYEYHTALCGWIDNLSVLLAEGKENRSARRVRMAVDYIDENFRNEINMSVLSERASMNYTQFSNQFKRYTGCCFSAYLKNLRLTESRKLLADPSLSIRSVGEATGFTSEKHFIKCFKQETGVSPGDYRQNLQIAEQTFTEI